MKLSKIALVGGSVVLALSGMAVAACSSSTPTPVVVVPGQDSSTTQPGDGGPTTNPDTGTTTNPDTGTTTNPDAGPTVCAKPPGLHVPKPDGGLYCPFSYDTATDAGIQYCAAPSPQCCVSPKADAGSSSCAAAGPCADPAFKEWQCSAPSECDGYAVDAGTEPVVCCLISGPVGPDPNCAGFQKTKGLGSVTCVPASHCSGPITIGTFQDTHYVACEQQSDCTASAAAFGGDGGTCTPVKTSGTSIGLCL